MDLQDMQPLLRAPLGTPTSPSRALLRADAVGLILWPC